MPNCYICDLYMEECIIDPKTGKIRHCVTCDTVIQSLLDSYEAQDKKKRKIGEGPFVDVNFDEPDDPYLVGILNKITHTCEDNELTD